MRQWLTTGDCHITRREACDLRGDTLYAEELPATERVFRITVNTAQGAAGKAYKDCGNTDRASLALQRIEDFGDAQVSR